MTEQEKQIARAKLSDKLEKLKKQVIELKELTQPQGPDDAIGRVSRMDAINNRSINEAALRKKSIQKQKIEEALLQIDSPDFGNCIKCGSTIQIERLMLIPESNVCVQCAR